MIRELPHWTIFELCKVTLGNGVSGVWSMCSQTSLVFPICQTGNYILVAQVLTTYYSVVQVLHRRIVRFRMAQRGTRSDRY